MTATARIVEFPDEAPELVEGPCVRPDDPPKMLGVMTPCMDVRKRWLHDVAEKGLWVAVAFGADGGKQGLAECVPIEWAAEPVSGDGSPFINCLWVLPRYWKTGVGRALMEHVIDCAANDGSGRGAGGVLGASTKHVVEVLYSSQCPWSGWMIDGIRNHIG